MDELKEIETAIKLSRLKGVGAAVFKKLIDENVLPTQALKVWEKSQCNRKQNPICNSKNPTDDLIEKTLDAINQNKFKTFYYGQVGYPSQLNSLTEPPPIVYLTSEIKNKPLAAVVGSRNSNNEQLEKAKIITLKLIQDGYGIVSGGAVGVDKIAHETALSKNAYTIAVLANGLDIIYPKIHKELFEQIKEKGTLMTELMLGAKPQKGFFPTRNRLIAALSDVIVALPTEESSGTYITVKWANKLGKKLIQA